MVSLVGGVLRVFGVVPEERSSNVRKVHGTGEEDSLCYTFCGQETMFPFDGEHG